MLQLAKLAFASAFVVLISYFLHIMCNKMKCYIPIIVLLIIFDISEVPRESFLYMSDHPELLG